MVFRIVIEQFVCIQVELQEFAVFAIRPAVVVRILIGCLVLFGRQQLSCRALLELGDIGTAGFRNHDQLLRRIQLAPMVTADLRDKPGWNELHWQTETVYQRWLCI